MPRMKHGGYQPAEDSVPLCDVVPPKGDTAVRPPDPPGDSCASTPTVVFGPDLNDWCRKAGLYSGGQMVTRVVLDMQINEIVRAKLYVEEWAPKEVIDNPPDLRGAEVEIIPTGFSAGRLRREPELMAGNDAKNGQSADIR